MIEKEKDSKKIDKGYEIKSNDSLNNDENVDEFSVESFIEELKKYYNKTSR